MPDSPSPIELIVRNIAVASIVDDQQVVVATMFEERGHLHAELDAGIGHRWDGPSIGSIVVAVSEDVFQGCEISFGRSVFFPSQEQDRDAIIRGALGLTLDQHGSILKMPRKGLEIMALGWRGLGDLLLLKLQEIILAPWSRKFTGNMGDNDGQGQDIESREHGLGESRELTDSGKGAGWADSLGAGKSRLFLAGCSIYRSSQWTTIG